MLRDEDEGQQLAGLTELCEYLSISTEDTLAAFPTEQVVPLLVGAAGRPRLRQSRAALRAAHAIMVILSRVLQLCRGAARDA